MKQVLKENKIPIMLWSDDIDNNVYEQASNLANLPFVHNHVALMPDCHLGYGMPIGGVIACKNVIIPNAVGSDIGCGMCAVNTNININKLNEKIIKEILSEIRRVVPTGTKKHKNITDIISKFIPINDQYTITVSELLNNAYYQLGTLGAGNHFVEIQKDKSDNLWIMIHSGSRNLGYKICEHYNKIAKDLNSKYYSTVPINQDLAFLHINTKEAEDYVSDMTYCIYYAKANRKMMMYNSLKVLNDVLCTDNLEKIVDTDKYIDVPHNYARLEHHFNKNVWVHRKGATSAKKDEIGLIPGSQGSASFVVKGKGNKLSFTSCSHGAGRTMSRKKAKETLDFEHEVNELNKKGIIHTVRTIDDLDESTGSYKDIYKVMDNQSDLVDIVEELTPIACIKGKMKRRY